MRFIYALTKALTHYTKLKHIRQQAICHPYNLDLHHLKKTSVRAIAWDFDGILASHGQELPDERMISLLQQSCELFPNQVYILSNKPLPVRAAYFKEHFSQIHFIKAKRKKPYPDGLLEIVEHSKLEANNICLIDDRLLTGSLAAVLAGTQIVYCKKPFVQYKKAFFAECFFQFLRKFERLVF